MRKVFSVGFTLLFILSQFHNAQAGLAYGDPVGGWAYTFDANIDQDDVEDLGGGWEHDNGSDSFDGSAIGEGAAGGVSALKDGDISYLRLQDTGDPRDYFFEVEDDHPNLIPVDGDPSNRKVFFDRNLIDEDDILPTYVDDGFTFSFRARIATAATGPIDPWFPDGGGADDDWPEEGLGYQTAFNSSSNFSFYMPDVNEDGEGDGALGFALVVPNDNLGIEDSGLLLNDLNGDLVCDSCGDTGQGDLNVFAVENMQDWHEFWVTMEKAEDIEGTHVVTVYVDGSTDPTQFEVTAGNRNEGGGIDAADMTQGPLSIGFPGTSFAGAFDLDFLSYANGVLTPGGGGKRGDFDGDGDCDIDDINSLTEISAAETNDAAFDLTGDGLVNFDDIEDWITSEDIAFSWVGDANLDRVFNTKDFIDVFQINKFEKDVDANWSEGDWDGDGRFKTGDLVKAFQDGGFEKGERTAVNAVPEPSGIVMLLIGAGLALTRRRR